MNFLLPPKFEPWSPMWEIVSHTLSLKDIIWILCIVLIFNIDYNIGKKNTILENITILFGQF